MKKQRILALCLVLLLVTGCAAVPGRGPQRYETSFLDLFDTVTTVSGYADSEAAFQETAAQIRAELERYHRLFDIYHTYPGVTNLKTVNDQAGAGPVTVERDLMDFLLFCRQMEQTTGGAVNPAMGSVLTLWHQARSLGLEDPDAAALPDPEALQAAAEHTRMDHVLLDEQACTVEFADPLLKLDVGAVAKGYAAEQICRALPPGYLVGVGGNLRASGPKPDGSGWVVGLQDPDGTGHLRTLRIENQSVVTSGDYQRYYTVDGVRFHHIIDPDTLLPGEKWRSVSVICGDSAAADALSTALFLLDREAGQRLLTQFDAEALWVDREGKIHTSAGFAALENG